MRNFAIVAYVPVLHSGYLGFLKRHPGDIHLLDPKEFPMLDYLARDMRALPPALMVNIIKAALSKEKDEREVGVANEDTLRILGQDGTSIILPDEDVSRAAAEKFLGEANASFDPIVLRWDWGNVQKAVAVESDREISTDALLVELMGRAYAEASRSPDWWRQVGALLVRDGKVITSGFNVHMPTEHSCSVMGDPRSPFKPGQQIELSSAHHAEKEIICWAARKGVSTEGASLMVTTFPCPVCAMDIVRSGICKVYYSEGYSLVAAQDILRSGNVEIVKVSKPPLS